jgi:hypothetical protein
MSKYLDQNERAIMKTKTQIRRQTRADYAIISWLVAFLLGADAWANRETADYYHDRALGFVLLFVGIGFVLLAYNAIQYAVMLRKNKL